VIVEDGAFIGSRCIVVEGVVVEEEAVLGANVVLTASTPIVDVTGEPAHHARPHPRALRGDPRHPAQGVPRRRLPRPLRADHRPRKESTDRKTSLNDVLRTFDVQV
jgi:2,3,4,5-tetrahydropyridine-2,6-dicarboxylate N-succinyltransferase